MNSSFNVFGKTKREFGGHTPIWLGTVAPMPVGGSLASDFVKKGAFYPAGTPINISGGVITPLVAFEVVSFSAAESPATEDTLVIKPCVYGDVKFLPEADDLIQVLGTNFSTTKKAAVVASIAENSTTAGNYDVKILHSATIDSVSAGGYVVFSSATAAGSSKSMDKQPNAYLYNDIWCGEIDPSLGDAGASGAAVDFHGEGLLIARTPANAFKAEMKAAVPNVMQR